jgi:FkbH-like protein
LDDAFGEHGIIGVVVVNREDPRHWEIDTWLMSCRVLERGVEQTLMNELVTFASTQGCASLRGTYIPTERNGLVADFFERMQFAPIPTGASDPRSKRYELDLETFEPFTGFIAVSR